MEMKNALTTVVANPKNILQHFCLIVLAVNVLQGSVRADCRFENASTIYASEFATVTLEGCECAGVLFTWKFGKEIISRERNILETSFRRYLKTFRNYSLQITNFTHLNEGIYQYTCGTVLERRYNIKVKPSFYLSVKDTKVTSSGQIYVEEGSLISIACKVNETRSDINLTWMVNNEEATFSTVNYSDSPNYDINHTYGYVSVLTRQFSEEKENVTCIRNIAQSATRRTISLQVLTYVNPFLYFTLNGSNVTGGNLKFDLDEEVFLACHAHGARPTPCLNWLVNNVTVVSKSYNTSLSERSYFYKQTLVLLPQFLQDLEDTGEIACISNFNFSSPSRNISLRYVINSNIENNPRGTLEGVNGHHWKIVVTAVLLIISVALAMAIRGLRTRTISTTPLGAVTTETTEREHDHNVQGENENPENGGRQELPLKRADVTLLSRLCGGGKITYWTAVSSSKQNQNLTFVAASVSDSAKMKDLYNFGQTACKLLNLGKQTNIVQCIGADVTEVPYYTYHEYVEGGTLRDFLLIRYPKQRVSQINLWATSSRQHSAEDHKYELTRFAVQVTEGMSFLLENDFCHPALCSRKVLLNHSGACKLYDFVPSAIGKSRLMEILEKKYPPLSWLPPEAIFLRQHEKETDVWSFGVTLWEIFSLGETPYEGLTAEEIEQEIRNERCLKQPFCCPGGLYSLMLSTWNAKAADRPAFTHILQQMGQIISSSILESKYSIDEEEEEPNYLILEERSCNNYSDS